jgi:hypothetical protein
MTEPARARFLHVANGSATTKTIEAAGLPGIMSIWADPLHDGPVPGELSDEELLALRLRFLGPPLDPESRVQQWRLATESSGTYDELILWFEHDLFDQLNLIQVLTWISDHVPTTTPVSLICVGSFPGRPDFKGLGELTADELASLLETREPVGARHYEAARLAWRAFRAPTPEALDALRHRDLPEFPYLGAAITRFLQEYPWTRDGLSRTERRLLQLAHDEGISLRRAFPRMHDGEQAYYLTDTSLTELAEALSRTTPPLATLHIPEGAEDRILAGTIALTEAGRAVLAGQVDRVATCGIDRWLGGVHLQSGRSLWRWDDGQRRVVR